MGLTTFYHKRRLSNFLTSAENTAAFMKTQFIIYYRNSYTILGEFKRVNLLIFFSELLVTALLNFLSALLNSKSIFP